MTKQKRAISTEPVNSGRELDVDDLEKVVGGSGPAMQTPLHASDPLDLFAQTVAAAQGAPASAPPAGSTDHVMNVLTQPPPVQPVNHSQPLPPHATSSLSPGLVDHFQPAAPPPANGTPGVTTNFSSSGDSNGW